MNYKYYFYQYEIDLYTIRYDNTFCFQKNSEKYVYIILL